MSWIRSFLRDCDTCILAYSHLEHQHGPLLHSIGFHQSVQVPIDELIHRPQSQVEPVGRVNGNLCDLAGLKQRPSVPTWAEQYLVPSERSNDDEKRTVN